MKIGIILGTRPEIIKLSPIIRALQKEKINFFILHTGQHYSPEMDQIFFEELQLPHPDYHLKLGVKFQENPDGCSIHGQQTGMMLAKIEKILVNERPQIVLVQGDTNSVLAGALAATKLHIKVGHIEAGLRSYDNYMPEEINRILTDKISDMLFCPTELQKNILLKEGVPAEKIFVTGNTIVDALMQTLELSSQNNLSLNHLKLENKTYLLLTMHREETVDIKKRVMEILRGLDLIYKAYKIPIICPLHPRTKNKFKEFKINIPEYLHLINPVGYLSFLQLMRNAKAILTDSGGVQEEACILQIPCITIRENTERPETIEVGANKLTGYDSQKIFEITNNMLKLEKPWENPFGVGDAGERIIKLIKNAL